MRLIDADTLKIRMLDYYQYSQQLCEEISDFFDNTPTIEPERKKGQWEMVSQHGNPPTYIYRCSECRHKSFGFYNYCPNCGAEMGDTECQST